MIRTLIRQVFPLTLIVGIVAMLTLSIVTDNNFTVLTEETTYIGKYTFTYYQFHMDRYLLSIQTSRDIEQLKAIIPSKPEFPQLAFGTLEAGFKTIVNILFYVLNWIIWLTNITLLAPIKLIMYPINVLYSLIGLNTSSNEAIQAFQLLYSLNIPLIRPI